jgi:hypothetical protein
MPDSAYHINFLSFLCEIQWFTVIRSVQVSVVMSDSRSRSLLWSRATSM